MCSCTLPLCSHSAMFVDLARNLDVTSPPLLMDDLAAFARWMKKERERARRVGGGGGVEGGVSSGKLTKIIFPSSLHTSTES